MTYVFLTPLRVLTSEYEREIPQLTCTCSNSTTDTLEKGVK